MPDPFGGACEKTKIRLVFDFRGTGIKARVNKLYIKQMNKNASSFFFLPSLIGRLTLNQIFKPTYLFIINNNLMTCILGLTEYSTAQSHK